MFKNKVLKIVIFLLLLLTFFITNSFASTTLINSLNVRDYYAIAEEFANSYDYTIYDYIITSSEDEAYIYIYPTEEYRCNIIYSSRYSQNLIQTESCKILAFKDVNNPNSYTLVDGHDYVGYTNADCIIWSSFDIYNEDSTLFFQVTPLSKGILAPIMGEVKPITKEIVITLVGLLKLLIPFLICLLGFWKGWKILLKILHQA